MNLNLRSVLLGILLFGMVGTITDLLLLGHVEGALQVVPIALIVAGAVVAVWHGLSRTRSSLLTMQVIMIAFVASGVLGIVLHSRGNAEFQKEIDPSIQGFDLVKKVLQSKAPPAMAPGLMAQLGLLGLAYAYRYPKDGRNE